MTDRLRCFAAPLLALLLVAASGRAEEVAEPSDDGRAAARAKLAAQDKAEALQALKRMSDYLAAQKNFSFTADVGYDVRQTGGQMLEFGGSRNVTVRQPHRIRRHPVKMAARTSRTQEVETVTRLSSRNVALRATGRF